jgi:bifunctional DNase/RNase
MVSGLGAKIQSVRITDLTDGVFFAVIDVLRLDGSTVQVNARPSDAIAIALRADAPISASEEVVDEAGVEIPMDSDSEGTSSGVPEDQVEKFREFLEGISPEDFEAPNS